MNEIGLQDQWRPPILNTIKNFPKQFAAGWSQAQQADLEALKNNRIDNFYYAAMGGSSLPADLFNALCNDKFSLVLHRDYGLPANTKKQDLVICASFSGNTEETLSAWQEAGSRNLPRLALSNGGKLAQLATDDKQPYIKIPDCIQPRCATGYFIGALLSMLFGIQALPSYEDRLNELSIFLENHQETWEAQGREIAKRLFEKVPIVYGPTEFYEVCRIWKIKLNENAKIQSFFNVFPELNHNEMVGFTKLLMPIAVLLLRPPHMNPRIAQRMKVMTEVLPKEVSIIDIELLGNDPWKSSFEALAIGDYASYYLAKEYGIDPAPVEMVENFKKRLT